MAEYPLYLGKLQLGRIVQHGPTEVDAFDAAGRRVGRFDSLGEAIAAIPAPADRGTRTATIARETTT